jgi:copper chaperone CopZ
MDMIRRQFIGLMTLAGAGGLIAREGLHSSQRRTVHYRVTGFTCITCAVGLETLLKRHAGVVEASASYRDGTTTVTYDSNLVSDAALVEFIESAGFHAHKLS